MDRENGNGDEPEQTLENTVDWDQTPPPETFEHHRHNEAQHESAHELDIRDETAARDAEYDKEPPVGY